MLRCGPMLLLLACADRPLPLGENGVSGGVNGGATNGGGSTNGNGGTSGGTSGGSTNGGGTNGNNGPAPRLLAPLSTSIVTSRRPLLRWDSPDGDVDLCADRA